ncbi:MAG: lipocalin family protein [Bacteroidales bacterium]|nr:lipocalin family protein [Bacteroidales bacterium]
MKTRNLLSGLLLSLFFLFTLTSCEKDQNALLTDGAWTFKNMTTDSEVETIQSFIALAKALFTDATLEFQAGGNYLITSPLMQEPSTGTWSLVGDDQLILNPEGEAVSTGNIETLSKSQLTYIETFTDSNMNTYSVTTTWIR